MTREAQRHVPHRYLGLELAGAKNQKTALAALEFYPRERKVFLLDLFDKIVPEADQSSDDALIDLIQELSPGVARIGVNVPLELPPYFTCSHKRCGPSGQCKTPAVKWMRDFSRKASRGLSPKGAGRILDFTPYTQRPVELWIRHQLLPKLPEIYRFEVDEAFGGNKAPLTARMHYLKRFLRDFELAEIWPKLSVSILAQDLGMDRRLVSRYRQLEEGIHAREEILEALAKAHGIFIYERDVQKLAHNLSSFDAFICAYTALLADTGRCAAAPKGFPNASGWVCYPLLEGRG